MNWRLRKRRQSRGAMQSKRTSGKWSAGGSDSDSENSGKEKDVGIQEEEDVEIPPPKPKKKHTVTDINNINSSEVLESGIPAEPVIINSPSPTPLS